jgi:ATP-dependent Lon protease
MAATDTSSQQGVTLPLVAVPGGVVFPGTVVTLTLDSEEARTAVDAARVHGQRVLLVPRHDGRYATVGVIAAVESVGDLPMGGRAAILRALQRGRVGAAVASEQGGLWVNVEPIADSASASPVDELARELRAVLQNVAELRNSRRLPEILRTIADPGALADAVTSWSEAPAEHQIDVLEAVEVSDRVDLVLSWAREHLAELQVARQIRDGVAEGVEKQQREFLLRQQLQAIRKELGEGDEAAGDDYRAKFDALPLPVKVREAVDKELDRLERTSGQSPEQGWIRTWLDRVLEIPWGSTTADRLDLAEARAVLDADHEGLDDVKERIVEFLAVRKLRTERGLAASPEGAGDGKPKVAPRRGDGAIVALVGPPGVGKTSLGESVARAMGRSFVRVALGGVRDEAEIRGHRRTYVGSQPGRIVRAISEAGTMNPVVLLDEVDKLSAGGWSGDPTAALLEVLDPAQNHTFRDHYLEVELDLSDVVFIATANVIDTIPGPLLDRMELVRLDGYTEDEKLVIGRNHLLVRQLERTGLRADEIEITDEALRRIIADYTREAGVRSFERELSKLLRKVTTKVASGDQANPIVIDVDDVRTYLGRAKFHDEVAERTTVPGVATGLAVTGVGGDVLFIEVSASDGEPALTLTGQLGDVMKESAQIALSYVRAHAPQLDIDPESTNRRVHVHVPAGAVPKDGPSAGITMTTALVSLLTGRQVKPNVGMTGEVTLQGKVLPIGGVKQKVLAAHRAGLTEVILPQRNGPDLDDVPERVREVMTFHLADTVDQVLAHALT